MPETEARSMEQPSPQSQFVAMTDVKVITGGREALVLYLSSGVADLFRYRAFVVMRRDRKGFYVFGWTRFYALVTAAWPLLLSIEKSGPTDALLDQVRNVLQMQEWPQADVVAPGSDPAQNAVAHEGSPQFDGTWDAERLRGVFLSKNERNVSPALGSAAESADYPEPAAGSMGYETLYPAYPASASDAEEIASPSPEEHMSPEPEPLPPPDTRLPRERPEQMQQQHEQQADEHVVKRPRYDSLAAAHPPRDLGENFERWFRREIESSPAEAAPAPPMAAPAPASAPDSDRRGESHGTHVAGILGTPVPQPIVDEVLQRTPHMNLSKEGPVRTGDLLDVSIYVDTGSAHVGELTEDIVIRAPSSMREFLLTVHLCTTEHFSTLGAPSGALIIKRDEPTSGSVKFQLRVISDPVSMVAGAIVAAFDYQGRPCGKVVRAVMVGPAVGSVPITAGPIVTSAESEGSEGPRIALMPQARPPDMTITILDPDNTARAFNVIVTTPLLDAYKTGVPGAWNLNGSSSEIVRGFFEEFTRDTLSDSQRRDALLGAGEELFQSTPKHFREALWQIIDQGLDLRSILVVSQEPFIPWELMIPSRVLSNGDDDVRPALGISYAVGRWICGDNISPAQYLPLTESNVIAPNYRGTKPPKLLKAEAEAAFVISNFNGQLISPAKYNVMEAVMKGGGASLLHIVCHGAAQTAVAQQIYFEDGEIVSSSQLRGNSAFRAVCRKKQPLIFLNACEVGRLQPALVGVGGFARMFVDHGARAVVAPLWSVKDAVAHDIAIEFYSAVLATPQAPFAEILRSIRAKAYNSDVGVEDTYAAYCFYGDPLACRSEA